MIESIDIQARPETTAVGLDVERFRLGGRLLRQTTQDQVIQGFLEGKSFAMCIRVELLRDVRVYSYGSPHDHIMMPHISAVNMRRKTPSGVEGCDLGVPWFGGKLLGLQVEVVGGYVGVRTALSLQGDGLRTGSGHREGQVDGLPLALHGSGQALAVGA